MAERQNGFIKYTACNRTGSPGVVGSRGEWHPTSGKQNPSTHEGSVVEFCPFGADRSRHRPTEGTIDLVLLKTEESNLHAQILRAPDVRRWSSTLFQLCAM